MTKPDDAAMQAECIVRAIEDYIRALTAPYPQTADCAKCSKRLSDTIAASLRMSEPRRNPLQER